MAFTLEENFVARLQALEPGWNSYGGNPITPAAIECLKGFYVVPLGDGGIQLETHQDGWDIEIGIGPDGTIMDARARKCGGDELAPTQNCIANWRVI